jgi:phytoene synthase
VREDLSRGRVYLPADELAYFQITEADLAAGVVDARWVAFMRFQIDRARALYGRSLLGLPYLNGFRSRRLVRLMASLYGHILTVMERWGYDVFTSRARVPFGRKLVLAAGVLLTPDSHAGAIARPLPQLSEGLSR